MKKKTGFIDRNNKAICVGDKVRVYHNSSYRIHNFWLNNGYEGIVKEDKDRHEDRYRIIHYMGDIQINSSLAWECNQRREFIEIIGKIRRFRGRGFAM